MKETNLIKKYLVSTAKPTFSHFSNAKERQIEKLSLSLPTNTAINLQRHWGNEYNTCVNKWRPGKPLVGKISKTSLRYKMIHQVITEKKKLKHTLRLAALAQTRGQTHTMRLIAENQEDVDEEEEENDDEEEEEEEEEEEDTPEEHADETIGLSADMMNSRKALALENKTEVQEFDKLLKSSCINLLHQDYTQLYRKVVPRHVFNEIINTCAEYKTEFADKCDQDTKSIIDRVFDKIKEFQYDENIYKVLDHLDKKKSSIKDKTSDEYTVLCIVDEIVKSFKTYANESKLSEATYLRKFSQILDHLLLSTTWIETYDGETVSGATRRMLMTNREEVDYGRRVDMIVKTKDGEQQYELASNEFKKSNASNDVLKYQQSKNIRINACIKNEIDLLLNNHNTRISYFDFEGRNAYISQLFGFEGCLVAFKVGSFSFPKNLIQLDSFRSSLKVVFAWKNATIRNSQDVLSALSNEEAMYNLVDVADDLLPRCLSPPRKPQLIPAEVYLSPSKRSNRN